MQSIIRTTPHPILLKVSKPEHRTPLNSAYKVVALFFVFLVIPLFACSAGQNDSASTDSSQGSRQPVWGTAEQRQSARTNSSAGVNREKQLYYDMAVAEDRGDIEALRRSGGCAQDTSNMDVAMYTSLSKQLMVSYGDQVLAKYGVSRAQWSEVMLKGATERWETPNPPTC